MHSDRSAAVPVELDEAVVNPVPFTTSYAI